MNISNSFDLFHENTLEKLQNEALLDSYAEEHDKSKLCVRFGYENHFNKTNHSSVLATGVFRLSY